MLIPFAGTVEDDIGNGLPAAADGSRGFQLLNSSGLMIRVVLPRLGKLRFVSGELLDDFVDLRLRRLRESAANKPDVPRRIISPNIRIATLP